MDTSDLTDSASALLVGLVTLTIQIFPFALPLLVLVVGPLAVLGLAVAVVAAPILLPLLLVRALVRRRRRAKPHGPRADALGPKHALGPGILAVGVDDK